MRCRNCHTVMMDSDSHCVSCGASAARATAGAPELTGEPNPMLKMLPMFGGLAGGLLYVALTSGNTAPASASYGPAPSRGSSPWRWIFGLGFIIVGGLLLGLAGVHFWETWQIAQREPTVATAADLSRRDFVTAPPAWVTYTFAESKKVDQKVKRRRLGNGGEVEAECILVRVNHKWLLTTVAPGFEGDTLVGRLLPIDSPISEPMITQIRQAEQNPSIILPYEFVAVEGCASDQQVRYGAAGLIAGLGGLGMLLGVYLFAGGRRSAPVASSSPELATTGLTVKLPTQ